ncbi:hypothetical protein [Mesorhizobium sp. LNHC221B00]|uniref:hypothetical protein n=1 Tax=Mesorhizobium sp. LNHC221B00 TaxID=1287233 RepID=UPI0004CF6FCC|nr:hypothetical protein [Mesorhizobium sp. LNHC221B00]
MLRRATRDEFDRKKAVWHIPAERMKMRAPHDVPLSKQALSVLEGVWQLSEDGGLVIKAALQFLALTCVRPGEVRGVATVRGGSP